VRAAALVAYDRAPEGELVLELDSSVDPQHAAEGVRDAIARQIGRNITVRVIRSIPMDARHASKVLREPLVRQLERAG
jgi:hypothetical protein